MINLLSLFGIVLALVVDNVLRKKKDNIEKEKRVYLCKISELEKSLSNERLALGNTVKYDDVILDLDKMMKNHLSDLFKKWIRDRDIPFMQKYSMPAKESISSERKEASVNFMRFLSDSFITRLALYVKVDVIDIYVRDKYERLFNAYMIELEELYTAEQIKINERSTAHIDKKKEEIIKKNRGLSVDANNILKLFGGEAIVEDADNNEVSDSNTMEFYKARYVLNKQKLDAVRPKIKNIMKDNREAEPEALAEAFVEIADDVLNGEDIAISLMAESLDWVNFEIKREDIETAKMTIVDRCLKTGETEVIEMFGPHNVLPNVNYIDNNGEQTVMEFRMRPIFYKPYIYKKGYRTLETVIEKELGEIETNIMEVYR